MSSTPIRMSPSRWPFGGSRSSSSVGMRQLHRLRVERAYLPNYDAYAVIPRENTAGAFVRQIEPRSRWPVPEVGEGNRAVTSPQERRQSKRYAGAFDGPPRKDGTDEALKSPRSRSPTRYARPRRPVGDVCRQVGSARRLCVEEEVRPPGGDRGAGCASSRTRTCA